MRRCEQPSRDDIDGFSMDQLSRTIVEMFHDEGQTVSDDFSWRSGNCS